MNQEKIEYLKGLLLEELANCGESHQEHVKELQEDLEGVDNHMADAATELEMMTTEMALEEHSKDEIEKVQAALQAIEDGTYGVCTVCKKEIPYERLEVMPTALTCVEHASA